MILWAFILAILGGFSNSFFRGGWWKTLFPEFAEKYDMKPFDDDVPNAILFAISSGLVSQSWKEGLAMGVAMFAGAMFAIFNDAADTAFNFRRKLEWSCHVIIRGLKWCLPIGVVAFYFHSYAAFTFIIPALLMPAAYSYNWFYTKPGPFHAWALSEITFGIILWLCLLITYTH